MESANSKRIVLASVSQDARRIVSGYTYHANKHVFGSLTRGNVTTTAGSWTSL
jgi:hypothetical protein